MREYGGYLPLELRRTGGYYNFDSSRIIKTNSGLTSIFCALKIMKPERIFLPYFICPTVDRLAASLGFETARYHISSRFRPAGLCCSREDCVVVVNYFGIHTEMVKECCSRFPNVIIDNTQAFFSEPVFRKGVYNVYSCRKFIGVPDGGYLIGTDLPESGLEQDYSSRRSQFLLMQYEYGVNGAYRHSLRNYRQIENERRKMSALTERILESADYDRIKNSRRKNFQVLDRHLNSLNELDAGLSAGDVPYSYPFMIRKDIRSGLLEHKIYAPWIWKEKLSDAGLEKAESDFIKYIFHLPVDQRYNERDMAYIAQTVLDLSAGGGK